MGGIDRVERVARVIDRVVSVTRFGAVALGEAGAWRYSPRCRRHTRVPRRSRCGRPLLPGELLAPVALPHVPRATPLAFAPAGDVACDTVAPSPGRCALWLYDWASDRPRAVVELDGLIEEVHWSDDAREVLALVVEPAATPPAPAGRSPPAARLTARSCTTPDGGRRRLVRVDSASGSTVV